MQNIRVSMSAIAAISLVILTVPRFSLTTCACPLAPPQPLRMLYTQSDLIVVARIGESAVAGKNDHWELLKTELLVSSTHKGKANGSVIQLYHWSYSQDRKLAGKYKQDDTLLLFLKERKDTGGYHVNDLSYGVKHLSDDDLKVYLDRISELATILEQDKPSHEEIVEWLVRCAEEPATRWEGAYEFALSTYALNSIDDSSADGEEEIVDEESTDDGQVEEAGDAIIVEEVEEDEDADPVWVMLLTEEQKERLAKALYRASEVRENEALLVNIVATWHDSRLPTFLLSQLNLMADNAPLVARDLMQSLADILNDKKLSRLVAQYWQNASYKDLNEGGTDAERTTALSTRTGMLRNFVSAVEKRAGN